MPKTFLTFRAAFLFKTPNLASDQLGVVPEDTTFQGTEQDDGFMKTRIERISTDEGFILMDGFAQEIADKPLPLHPKDADIFCALVTRAARDALGCPPGSDDVKGPWPSRPLRAARDQAGVYSVIPVGAHSMHMER